MPLPQKRALTSRIWIWLVMAAAVGFTARGVTLIVSADREQAEMKSLVELIAQLNGLEQSLREFEKGITPAELLPGERSESDLWDELLAQELRRADRVRSANPGPNVGQALADVEASVGRLGEIRRGVLDARSASADVTPLEIRYHREMDHAIDVVKAAVSALRSRLAAMSVDLAVEWRQLTLLVWVSCIVAILAAVLSAMYRRDLARRRQAEEALARVHAELEMRVEERTAELSLANALLTEQVRERRRAEQRLQRYAADLARSNAELQEFAYVASHDLQEPLRMVASYVQLLEKRYRDKLDPDADEFIAFAVDGVERMKQLILDLLAYARVDAGERTFARSDCAEILGDVLQNLKIAIEESRAEITVTALPIVTADATQIAQLLQNLIANAIRFRDVEPPRVRVCSEVRGAEHLFRIQDNGIGIDPAHFDRIFRLFQRLQPRTSNSGTGIGLAICKKIVERHGGRIWVESEPGKGTTILFSLPVRVSDAGPGAGQARSSGADAPHVDRFEREEPATFAVARR